MIIVHSDCYCWLEVWNFAENELTKTCYSTVCLMITKKIFLLKLSKQSLLVALITLKKPTYFKQYQQRLEMDCFDSWRRQIGLRMFVTKSWWLITSWWDSKSSQWKRKTLQTIINHQNILIKKQKTRVRTFLEYCILKTTIVVVFV